MASADLQRISEKTGVSSVLSLQHDECLAFWGIDYESMQRTAEALGLIMVRCPIRDFDLEDMRRQLPTAVKMLSRIIGGGHRVYVHCTAGMGRAPLTVLGYLSIVEGYHPDEAIQLILASRPEAVPAWEALEGCVADLTAQHWEAINRRAYELYAQEINGDAHSDWVQAQAEILRTALTS
jgi:atypical dual specificity phosphatase